MDMDGGTTGRTEAAAREQLTAAVASLTGAPHERRHEALMEWAESELGLEREYAEEIYALAEEEDLEPVYAFHLVNAGIGVRELESPEQDMEETVQQAPPDWVAEDAVKLEDVVLERRLRASFRRLRSHLEECAKPPDAIREFLAEPDVGAVVLR
ncbi:MAG TPA: hypothetical protein VHG09_00915 [Longimicrobiales bacterium]|nr:hypothetical protein [Longimicrobiales bacterium]